MRPVDIQEGERKAPLPLPQAKVFPLSFEGNASSERPVNSPTFARFDLVELEQMQH